MPATKMFSVVLSHDIFSQRSGTVIAMAVTSQPQRASFPLTMELKKVRLPKRSWVKISQIRTLSVDRFGRRLGRVTPVRAAHNLLTESLGQDTRRSPSAHALRSRSTPGSRAEQSPPRQRLPAVGHKSLNQKGKKVRPG
jgi:mRNA-degrading endonuclease toxin of MazEF toxin-antitoxin module